MGVLSHALFLKGVDLDTFFEGSRQMVKIYNFLCTEAKTIREKVFMEEQGFKMNLMNMTKWFRMHYYLWKGVLWRQEGYFRESGRGILLLGGWLFCRSSVAEI